MLPISWANQRFTLWPEKALYWPKTKSLFVADTHFGKDEAFRAHGVGIPEGTLQQDLDRLSSAMSITQPKHLFFLGDFYHSKEGVSENVNQKLEQWMERHSDVAKTLIRGNHDNHVGDPPNDWSMTIVDEPYEFEGLHLTHHPAEEPEKPTLSGHIHPSVKFGFGGFSEKCPCFFFRPMNGILPAFGSFTGNHCLPIGEDDQIVLAREGKLARVK